MAAAVGIDPLLAVMDDGDPALEQAFRDWQRWLIDERRCSPHTRDAYVRDLVSVLKFTANDVTIELKGSEEFVERQIQFFKHYLSDGSQGAEASEGCGEEVEAQAGRVVGTGAEVFKNQLFGALQLFFVK